MKIALLSDIHENFHNLLRAIQQAKEIGVSEILCLGDLINPGIAGVLARCGLPVYTIWGNNDGDRVLIMRAAQAAESQLTLSDKTYDFLERDGRRIFITHYTELARPMAKSGDFDLIGYGHDHQKFYGREGNCHIVNPGEISGHLTGNVTFATYDTADHEVAFITVDDAITLRTPLVAQYFQKK